MQYWIEYPHHPTLLLHRYPCICIYNDERERGLAVLSSGY
jgi:hypothetical protein